MKRLILIALAATALSTPALARDWWNGSGFPLDHNFHSPFDNAFGPRPGYGPGGYSSSYAPGGGGPHIIHVPPYEPTSADVEGEQDARQKARLDAERARTLAQERECRPVVLYTDEGRVVHPAQGCR